MLESLYFANPWGALALLGIPVVLAIHFFQQPARPQLISTLFLWQRESPESLRGSAWDRLRSSWPLWLQLLMVLLLVWLLLEPRWVQQWSRLNVIFVLDSSASMDAFRKETISTVDRLSRQFDNTANDVNWMLMPTHVSGGDGYHGEERIELMAVLNQWQPTEGRHDFLPALERGLMTQGRHGLLIFITDHDYVVPAGVSTYAVGRPLSNVGFTGARCFESDGTWKWEVLVRNFGDAEVERDWWVELNGEQGPVATLNLAAGQSGLLTGFFPEGVQKISMALAQDELQLDNRFPLVIPQQARIRLAVKTGGKTGQFINRLTEALPYVRLASADDQVDLVTLVSPFGFRSEDAPAEVVFRSKDKPLNKVVTLPVLVEEHPLVKDLSWDGLLSSGAELWNMRPGDQVLAWQGKRPLIVLGQVGSEPSLIFNFDFEHSNASRLPATIVLLHRYLQYVSRHLPEYRAENVMAGQNVYLPAAPESGKRELSRLADEEAWSMELDGDTREGALSGKPGFYQIKSDDVVLADYAAAFMDPAEGNLLDATTFSNLDQERERLQRQNSLPDSMRPLWLLVMLLALLTTFKLQPLSIRS